MVDALKSIQDRIHIITKLVKCQRVYFLIHSRSHTNQSWYRNTVPPCTTINVHNTSTRQRILLRVVWRRHPSTWAMAWCNTISRALLRNIEQAPATNFYLTPSWTILCFGTASSSWKTFGECWISAYYNTIMLEYKRDVEVRDRDIFQDLSMLSYIWITLRCLFVFA